MTRFTISILLATAALSALPACPRPAADGPAPTAVPPLPRSVLKHPAYAPLATVNGVELTAADLTLEMKTHGGHGRGEPGADQRKQALDGLVREELVAQKAASLGLEPAAPLDDEVAQLTVKLAAARRRALVDAFFRHEIQQKAQVTEADARRLFEEKKDQIQAEVRVNQLLLRDEHEANAVLAALRAGEPFEVVARRQFPNLPESAGRPWEAGPLAWRQLPAPWREVVFKLEPGKNSEILKGPNNRYWVLQLIERRTNPAVDFETVKGELMNELKVQRIEALKAKVDAELAAAAKVTFAPAPPPQAAPPPHASPPHDEE